MNADRIISLVAVALVVITIWIAAWHIIDYRKAYNEQFERSEKLQKDVDHLTHQADSMKQEAHRLLDPIPGRVAGRRNVWDTFEADADRVNDHSGTYMDSSIQRLIDGIDGTRPFVPH